MTNPLTATAAPVLTPLLSAAVRTPLWVTAPLFALGAAVVIVHLVLQLRAAREQERAAQHAEQRRAALEDEAVYAARTITDPTERTNALLDLTALRARPADPP
ncbi:hypothetical protein OG216_48000 (plasmid) [Streptomycetaceae bacterium NBC_01309]